MERTKLRRLLLMLRAENNQNMDDMSKVLGMSKSMLSRVETGERSVQPYLKNRILDNYILDSNQKAVLEQVFSSKGE